MSKWSVLREFLEYVRARKNWWLTPIIVLLVLFGALLVVAQGSVLSPFMYTLF